MTLTSEHKLLFAFLRHHLFGLSFDHIAPYLETIDWDTFFSTALEQDVLPIAFKAINDFPEIKHLITESIYSKWRTITVRQVLSNEKRVEEQREITELLEKENIDYIILKGTSIGFFYPDPKLRLSCDIDILIDQNNMERVLESLKAIGYKSSGRSNAYDPHEILAKSEKIVEIHRYIHDVSGRKLSVPELLRETEKATIGSYSFAVSTPSYQAIIILIHLSKHLMCGGLDLKLFCDWALFIEKRITIDYWESVLQPLLLKYKLDQFAFIISSFCINYLGVEIDFFVRQERENIDLDKVFEQLLDLVFPVSENKLFLARRMSERKNKNEDKKTLVYNILKNVSHATSANFPITRKITVFCPFMWVFCLMKYFLKYTLSRSKKTSIISAFHKGKRLKKLYSQLGI